MITSALTPELRELVRSPQNHCFACGPGNDCGMKLQFDEVGDEVRCVFEPEHKHSGWTGVVHGGIVATALDEAMAYVLYFMGIKGLTARMEVRYRRPALAGDTLTLVARKVSEVRRIVDVEAQLLKDYTVLAEASGRFMKVGPLTIRDLLPRATVNPNGEETA
jgi:acyl-coenzyme A thioesterase PaaI-like protein